MRRIKYKCMKHRPILNMTMFTGVLLGAFFWFLESAIEVLMFHKGNLAHRLFPLEPHEFWMRSLVGSILILFVMYSRFLTAKRKEVEKKLKMVQETNRQIMEHAKFGISIVNEKGDVEYVNPAQLRISGNTYEQMKGLNVFSLPTYQTVGLAERIKGALQGEFFKLDSIEYTSYYGKKTTVRNFIGIPLKEDRAKKMLMVVEDITESKRAKEEMEKVQAQLTRSARMAAVGTLASGVAHEFNNLLQIMSGNLELAQRTKNPKDVKETLNVALNTSDKAAKIIKNLLTFSRQGPSENEFCDITEPVESVVSLMESQLKKCNIRVIRKYRRTHMVEVNKAEMQQVFLDIVINGRDAMLPKGGRLEICVGEAGENVEVSFSDTGRGIEKENLSKVFEPFYTTKGAIGEDTIPGTGLGLYVSYGIIQRHGGSIEVESQVGQGTTFTVKLPLKEVRQEKGITNQEKEREVKETPPLNILVVDDEEEICKILGEWLSTDGHILKSASKGKKAIELVKNEYFDVVFLDIIMAGIPGTAVLEEIRKISPGTKVVIITGKLMDDSFLNGLKQKGASAWVQKPFNLEEIREVIS